MTFNDTINKIMPDVKSGSQEPFIIYRDKTGGWHCDYTKNQYGETFEWVERAKARDPFASEYAGKDFANGSFAHVYDEVLSDRISAEYHSAKTTNRDTDKQSALAAFFFDNVSALSRNVTDYLTTISKPLSALVEMCPVYLSIGKELDYNSSFSPSAIERIESAVDERLHINDKPEAKKRYIDGFVERAGIQFGGKTIVLAENVQEPGAYMICNITRDNPLGMEERGDIVRTEDYIYAMREFAKRIDVTAATLQEKMDAAKQKVALQDAARKDDRGDKTIKQDEVSI